MKTEPDTNSESFRDHIATADQQGQRLWVYPSKPGGKFFNARQVVGYLLIAFFFTAPFLKINGDPIILFDIVNRHFIIMGLGFRPHDLHILVLFILTGAVFLVLFTAVLGRIFCGWVCPQTVFVEMVYRRIEYFIDGSPAAQRKLSASSWTVKKLFKRSAKHLLFFGVSFLIANFVLAYFIRIESLSRVISDPSLGHPLGLFGILLFSAFIHFIYGWFREQACTIVCPYGRLQGVLIDSNSIVVAYDHVRGEPRGKMARNDDRADKGDCVDCGACVRVCPTGIDIRNGTQLECINCTACIDSCNDIMRRSKLPEGLIRYTSETRIEGKKSKITGRVILYLAATVLLTTIVTILMFSRTDMETTILRTPGTLYYELEEGIIRNLYNIKCVNRTTVAMTPILVLKAPADGKITIIQGEIRLEPNGIIDASFFVDLPVDKVLGPATPITIEVSCDGIVMDEVITSFMGPGTGGRK